MADDTPRAAADRREPEFEFTHDAQPSDALICGFSEFGLAGLTAADFLVDHLGLEQTGHVAVDGLPAITPFENGTPRHHTRFFSKPDVGVTVLVGELFVPVSVSGTFSAALGSWLDDNDVEETAVLSGVPVGTARTATARSTSRPTTTSAPASKTPTCRRWATASSTA